MALVFSIELLSGSYDAGDQADRERAEWPPHPARLFCALVAAARTESDRAALRWLECQPPPVVVAAAMAGESRRSAYVVINAVSGTGGSQSHPGRTNGLRVRSRALPSSPRVAMVWDDGPDADVLAVLDGMARRTPYLGRSTGISLVSAAVADGPSMDSAGDGVVFEPCDLLDGEVSVRVPYPGYLEQLDAQFADDRPSWEVSRYRGYRRRDTAGAEPRVSGLEPFRSMYSDVVVFPFRGLKPQGRLTVPMTSALRSAVLKASGSDGPAALHGHGADGRPHVAFLALPDVSEEHGNGHLLGLAVAVPELPEAERAAVLRAVLGLRRRGESGEDEVTLTVPRIGKVTLSHQPGVARASAATTRPPGPWGATKERWLFESRRWVSATPVVLDRFPKRAAQVENEILAGLRRVGLPEPVDLQVSTKPLVSGAADLQPSDLPRRARGRLFRHVAVDFGRPVTGPVLVGAGRYLGVGLLAPLREGGRRG